MENQQKHSRLIVQDIVNQIGTGVLSINQTLPSERQLAQLYHVSRGSIREAMQILALLGIVEIKAKGRTRVTAFQIAPFIQMLSPLLMQDAQDVRDIRDFRIAVETRAVFLAAQRRLDFGLEAIVTDMEQCRDEAEAAALDLQFHRQLMDASGSRLLQIAMDSVIKLMEISVAANRRQVAEKQPLEILIEQHRQLCRAIQSGEARQAARLMEDHLNLKEKVEDENK